MPSNARPQARNWCFTINNPSDETGEAILSLSPLCHYGVWQSERGANGTAHLQGYLAFKNRIRLATLKKTLPTAHLEIARGTPEQNISYCTKEDSRIGPKVEFGDSTEIPRKGERTDLAELQTAFDAGLTTQEYATSYFEFFLRYPKALENYFIAQVRPRCSTNPVQVTLLIGESGGGKSSYAERLAGESVYRHSLGQFWDGYRGERSVIFDDFRGNSISYGSFKHVCDRYPLLVHVKGTSSNMAATQFYITTNFKVEEWWDSQVTGPDLTPIYRRITEVLYFPRRDFSETLVWHFARFKTYKEFATAVYTPLPEDAPPSYQLESVPFQTP